MKVAYFDCRTTNVSNSSYIFHILLFHCELDGFIISWYLENNCIFYCHWRQHHLFYISSNVYCVFNHSSVLLHSLVLTTMMLKGCTKNCRKDHTPFFTPFWSFFISNSSIQEVISFDEILNLKQNSTINISWIDPVHCSTY